MLPECQLLMTVCAVISFCHVTLHLHHHHLPQQQHPTSIVHFLVMKSHILLPLIQEHILNPSTSAAAKTRNSVYWSVLNTTLTPLFLRRGLTSSKNCLMGGLKAPQDGPRWALGVSSTLQHSTCIYRIRALLSKLIRRLLYVFVSLYMCLYVWVYVWVYGSPIFVLGCFR